MQTLRQGDCETIFTQTIEKLDNGTTRINVVQTNMRGGSHTFDGHFWVERNGVMTDQSPMIRFIKESSSWASSTDPNKFIVFEYINAELEKKIIDDELKKQQENWGGEAEWARKIMALVPQRSNYGNDCFTRSSYELLTGGGVRRFGIVGIACPKTRRVYWVWGHQDNSTYKDFVVPNGDTTTMHGIRHTRETPFTPRIRDLWDSIRTKNTHVAPRIIKNEKDEQAKADKALAELLAMLDSDDKKKNKSNKKK